MKYTGKVYAKINGKYIECTQTVENLEEKIKELSSEWISINDRLPDLNITVIGYEETCGVFPAELDEAGWFDLESQVFIPPQQHVTHWMPFPKPPKNK